jgi:hypothetical protein
MRSPTLSRSSLLWQDAGSQGRETAVDIQGAISSLRAKGFEVGTPTVRTQRRSRDVDQSGQIVLSVCVCGFNLSFAEVIALDASGSSPHEFVAKGGRDH